MKTTILSSVGQPTSAAYKLTEAGVSFGSAAVPVEFVVGARHHTPALLCGPKNYHIAFCSAVMRPFGAPLHSCGPRTHSGGVSVPHDSCVNDVELPQMELDGNWNSDMVLHGYAIVSRNGPRNRVVFNRVICAEALDLTDTDLDAQGLFEYEGGVGEALSLFALRNGERNPRVGALLNRCRSEHGVNNRRLIGSPAALFRAAARPVITVNRFGLTNGAGELDSFPLPRDILHKLPRRFFERSAAQANGLEVTHN